MLDFAKLISSLPGGVAQGLIWGVMAIGVYLTYKILDIADLTVDGTMCTGGAVCVMMIINGHSVPVALLCAFLAGMAAGLVTGLLHTAMGIQALLAGILTQLALYSINLKIMGWGTGSGRSNQPISVDNYNLVVSSRYLFDGSYPWYKSPIFWGAVFCVVIILILYWFFGTELGCAIRATGANPNMSRAQGINVDFNKVLGLMLSNGLVALSSGLLAQYQGFIDINSGRGAIVIGLAAVIIGEVVFSRIFRNFALKMLGVVFGAIIYYMVMQVVLWLKVDSDMLKILSAAIVAIFLAVPYWKGKYTHVHVKHLPEAADGAGSSAAAGEEAGRNA
ncbi:putative ABC transport system permease protein [Oscillibacter sp. PC13]|uniref:ABC transporter permease n=1 Tax=Oscillibacter sp. PC13 TaxID=1855299 RepID=UPI0008E27D57|nr:ABC transporter permease [Oscillibacter sp. PC13]SFP51326.1 putative ABC transport system permease protein [Oscillibacter sp. PC13]